MKILHTSDWHLGAKTEGISRIEEQKKVLEEIVEIVDKEKINLVLIAGDIYDQIVPQSEAEDLFYETLEKLSRNENRAIVAIAGNHDDSKRLGAGEYFAKKHNVILCCNLHPAKFQTKNEHLEIESLGNGSSLIKFKSGKGAESCVVGALPYPAEYRLQEKAEGDCYQDNVSAWARKATQGFKGNCLNIFLSHLMLVGSYNEKTDEEIRVGDISAVSKGDLPRADYYALGHLHSFQNMKGNYCYSGAPLKYDYNQKLAGVVIVEANNVGVKSVEFRELKNAKKMEEISVTELDNLAKELSNFDEGDIVSLILKLKQIPSSLELKSIKTNFPCVKQIKLNIGSTLENKESVFHRNKLGDEALFKNFYEAIKGEAPSKEMVKLFKDLMEGNIDETN